MNEKLIWDFLVEATGNKYGAAAIMGNLMAESSMNPRCVTELAKTGYPDTAQYILASDDGVHDFAHDGAAFGLVQWCFRTRKEGLLNYAKSTGRSVGHLQMQLEYLVKEMSEHYKTAWKAACGATDIRTASDVIMLKYENPATKTEAAKKKRADYGKLFYIEYGIPDPELQHSGKKMVRARARGQVNIRSGPGMNSPILGELKGNRTAELISTENGWHKIAVYVKAEFTEVIS